MHDDRQLVEERIRRELTERVLPLVHPQRATMAVAAGRSLDDLAPFAVGGRWGRPWGTTWFRFSGDVPEAWRGRRVEALIDLGFRLDSPGFQCEGLVRDGCGRPVQGIHPRRQAVPVDASPGPVELIVEAASNPALAQFVPTSLGRLETAGDQLLYRLDRAELVVVDPDAEALLHDLDVLDGLMLALAADDARRNSLLRAIERALDVVVTPHGDHDVAAARRTLAPALAVPARSGAHRIVATGHAHIDTAWLWPLQETGRKCVRTFSSAVDLMDRHPEFRFSCSQAQQYAWVEQCEPELFARIADKVAGGQWIPVGGMWVEPDMNLPSGESIVRQIVHGQGYFEQRFGVRCSEVWIPDVFGYPGGLPQVFAAGGMTRFVTQKLSWNRTNRFPHSTFWWEGVDGTRVLTHFPPVDTYNAELAPGELVASQDRFAEHGWSGWSLVPFGYGDGGGGPTREMLARAARMADLDGVPPVEIGAPGDFFANVEAEIAAGADVPVWRGELYFETHRGTLTSQLRTKLGNRRCEQLLREAELWLTTAGGDAGQLDELWQAVLTQQFHDILPGSSIGWVHDEAEATLAGVANDLEARIAATLRRLAPEGTVLANSASTARDEVVVAAGGPSGPGPVQQLGDGRTAFRAQVPALGLAVATAAAIGDRVVLTDRSMTNGHLAVAWDLDGRLHSIIDVAHARQLVPVGAASALLELSVDHPVRYDAWDVESWARRNTIEIAAAERVDVFAAGPLVGMVRVERPFGPSRAVLTYTLRAGSPRLDVHVELDWHHDERLLSLAFPLDVRAETATCGIQFGAVRRPTHRSTSWDAAKFEVCAHRYVDVSEPSFGVAVLNDGRYGHGLFDGAVRVSLARAAKYPDPHADQGHHEVTVSMFPHGAGLASVVAEAEALNLPLRVVTDGVAAAVARPVVEVTGRGLLVDAVKPADDGSGDVIVRFHEACGDRVRASVRADRPITAASRCALLETPAGAFEVGDGIVALTLRPYELVTLRLTR
ncbi:MAG: alpha-mannosidase [Acidimicrobiia bacterium]|nr:alpha-mannosidase [Acidimicrobiia bacterium]